MSNSQGFMIAFGALIHGSVEEQSFSETKFDRDTGAPLIRQRTKKVITFPAFAQVLCDAAKEKDDECEGLAGHVPTSAQDSPSLIWAHILPGGSDVYVGAFLYRTSGGYYDLLPEHESFQTLSPEMEHEVRQFLTNNGIDVADIGYAIVNDSEW